MTIAAFGDLHMSKLDHKIPNFNKYLVKTLKSTITDALDRGSEAIVLVGDVFDGPYPSQTTVVEFLDAITDYDVPFYLLLGNHDFADALNNSLLVAKWTKKLKSNIIVVDKPMMLKVGGVNYQFLPHPYVEDMSKKADFGFAHFAINGAIGDNGFRVKTKNQPAGNWILGDFHTAQEGRIKRCIYDYVGSMTQLSWEEKSNKSYICIEDGEKTRRKIDVAYKLAKHTVSSDDELNAIKIRSDTFYYLKTKDEFHHPASEAGPAIGPKEDATLRSKLTIVSGGKVAA